MEPNQLPSRFVELKREIISMTSPGHLVSAWSDLLREMAKRTDEIILQGHDFIPQVNFNDLDALSSDQINAIRRTGSLVIRGVVDSTEAVKWKSDLVDFINKNPHAPGFPEDDKQFFHLYWTPSQVRARAHPNVLKVNAWLNNLYHFKSGKGVDGVDLSVPLVYADRLRIRHPGVQWDAHPPHIDGGSIERWEDGNFRRCFQDILTGNWSAHDPYELEYRLNARSSLYGRPDQATVFRTFQGWLALSETAPTQGTLRVFPDVTISNAYLMLRPFFRPMVPLDDPAILDPRNWELDTSTPDFPGIIPLNGGFLGPRPTPELHPHLKLNETMTSVPKVYPGDMVFWHCDVVHSVEREHTGTNDSAVMYIPAMPETPQNLAYVQRQAEAFLAGVNPPDFDRSTEGVAYVGLAVESDVKGSAGRLAMGLPIRAA
ncbi:hypothetical protein F5141DRAFT_1190563 [Pisolithus sp. B1]|nr:hypothetical protein F5141DRAFT_1190563 [Pisolithus sp. B1]